MQYSAVTSLNFLSIIFILLKFSLYIFVILLLSQTLFKPISTNILTIFMILTALKSSQKDLLKSIQSILIQLVFTKLSDN